MFALFIQGNKTLRYFGICRTLSHSYKGFFVWNTFLLINDDAVTKTATNKRNYQLVLCFPEYTIVIRTSFYLDLKKVWSGTWNLNRYHSIIFLFLSSRSAPLFLTPLISADKTTVPLSAGRQSFKKILGYHAVKRYLRPLNVAFTC